jgi:lysophospholipase L1-like esterase
MDGVCMDSAASMAEIDRLNQEILPALVEARPEVEIFPFADLACPGGFTQTLGDIDDARPDGIHFSPEAARWLADRYAPDLVNAR